MFKLNKTNLNINFVGAWKLWLVISFAAVLGSVGLFFTKGLNYGIDFTGGAEVQVRLPKDWDTEKLRSTLGSGGVKDARIQRVGEGMTGDFLIRTQGDTENLNSVSDRVSSSLKTVLAQEEFTIERADVVGPAAGSTLRKNGFLAMFYAFIVILIYIAFRFDSRYAPAAVLTSVFDISVAIGIFVLTGIQFDLTILAALLALIGYSINDTIVVFDRIREIAQMNPELSVEKTVNRAINQTMGRTIITSLTTLFTSVALWFFGGEVLRGFSFMFCIGVLIGTYSTIFVASGLVIWATQFQAKRGSGTKMTKGSGKAAAARG